MLIQFVIPAILAWSWPANGQQALLLFGNAVTYKDGKLSEMQVEFIDGGKAFIHAGKQYPYGTSDYFEMVGKNKNIYSVLKNIQIENKKVKLDGAVIELNHPVESIYQALKWGERIACLGVIPVPSKAWSPSKAYALILINPQSRTGSLRELGRIGKAKPDLVLLDPIHSLR